MHNDANLLFAMLAVQLDFIQSEHLIQAANQWMLDKKQQIGDILVRNGHLSKEDREFVDLIVQKHTQRTGSVEKSLSSFSHKSGLSSIDSDAATTAPENISQWVQELASNANWHDGSTVSFQLWEGRKVSDQFRIVRSLAEGGLGKVSVANDASLEREVAMKEILPRNALNVDAQARFLAEARVTGALEHPGIVPIYALGDFADGRPFYVMRLIRGRSLDDAIRQFHAYKLNRAEYYRRLRQLVRHLIDACNAIAYAHNRGVLHRDIKPNNIMLGKFGETLVVDWGLAKPLGSLKPDSLSSEAPIGSGSSNYRPTEFGSTVGTPGYMSPEQALGRLDILDRQADVFSLGATLYCILIGHSPFHSKDRDETMRRVKSNEYDRPSKVNSNVPVELDAIVAKALSHEPKQRFDSALELADELERWTAGDAVRSYPEPLHRRLIRFTKNHQQYVISGLILMALTTLGLVFFNQTIRNERDIATNARKRAEQSSKTTAGIINEFVKTLADNKWSQMPGMDEERLKMLDLACDRLSTEMELAPDDKELQQNSVMIFVRAANVNRTLGRLDRASQIFERIMPLISYGKPSELSDDDIATYTDALANYSAVLNATRGPEAALTKNDRNLELSLERFRRRPATSTQVGLVRALLERADLLMDLSEVSEARVALEKATESSKQVFIDSFRQKSLHVIDLHDFQIAWKILQCHMLANEWDQALIWHATVATKLDALRKHELLQRDSRMYGCRADLFNARILRQLDRTDSAREAIESAIGQLGLLDSDFPTIAYKRSIVEATIEKGLLFVGSELAVAQQILGSAESKLAQCLDASSQQQILPLQIQIAKLELEIANASNGTISPLTAQEKLVLAKDKLKELNPKSPWLR